MPTKSQLDNETFLKQYNPIKGPVVYVTAEQWATLRPVVLEAIGPLAHLVTPTLRSYLTSLTRLALFAYRRGYKLEVTALLNPVLIEAFLETVRKETKDPAPYLWRLAGEWGLVGAGDSHPGLSRPHYQTPYSHSEIESLLLAARNQSTTLRTATLLALIFLGAGCGVNRQRSTGVSASDVHQHGQAWFVRTPTYCARVRDEFMPLFDEVVELRGSGLLRGTRAHDSVTAGATQWLRGRRGVPDFSVDRLRATYICALLQEGASLVDTLAWSGLRGAESLNGYLKYVDRPPMHCAHSTKGAK